MRAKKPKVKKVIEKVVEDYNPEDDFKYLTGELFWKYRAIDAEFRNAMLALNIKKSQLAAEFEKNPQIVKLINERDVMAQQVSEQAKEVQAVNSEIEEKLGIKLRNCSIDDKTGRIYINE